MGVAARARRIDGMESPVTPPARPSRAVLRLIPCVIGMLSPLSPDISVEPGMDA
ncbi:hypothetical protein SXCC_02769 [Gluconacetobacter sp. SXCC-1]|nr:hypothetical protein SXCC_02769 [Gluconacetobacter sp. SXCC-1]